MRWDPSQGQVPRGACGAVGSISEVELVLVTAEPGDPLPGETHLHSNIESTIAFSIECLRHPATPFHQNIRRILDLCFPELAFEDQLRRVWRTNSVLCSVKVECGRIPRDVENICITKYLSQQIALVPHALVAASSRFCEPGNAIQDFTANNRADDYSIRSRK